MFIYPENLETAKQELSTIMDGLRKQGKTIFSKQHPIKDDLTVDEYLIKSEIPSNKRLILTIGLHGIEGYVGHAALMTFFENIYPHLKNDIEIVIFHPLNPYGMKHYRRANESNVDLNRNFTQNNFKSENPSYEVMKNFFKPWSYRSSLHANTNFYRKLSYNLIKHSSKVIEEATLFGQNQNREGIYYTGISSQRTTNILLEKMKTLLTKTEMIVWFDLHSGYGPRYQMSIVNSKYEQTQTKELIQNTTYPLILGLGEDDFYEIDGDMIEKIYSVHKSLKAPSRLYATCFEFGTLGDKTINMIQSLKALIFENACHYKKQTEKFNKYTHNLFKEQFMPSEEKWRKKAKQDFLHASTDILKHYNFL